MLVSITTAWCQDLDAASTWSAGHNAKLFQAFVSQRQGHQVPDFGSTEGSRAHAADGRASSKSCVQTGGEDPRVNEEKGSGATTAQPSTAAVDVGNGDDALDGRTGKTEATKGEEAPWSGGSCAGQKDARFLEPASCEREPSNADSNLTRLQPAAGGKPIGGLRHAAQHLTVEKTVEVPKVLEDELPRPLEWYFIGDGQVSPDAALENNQGKTEAQVENVPSGQQEGEEDECDPISLANTGGSAVVEPAPPEKPLAAEAAKRKERVAAEAAKKVGEKPSTTDAAAKRAREERLAAEAAKKAEEQRRAAQAAKKGEEKPLAAVAAKRAEEERWAAKAAQKVDREGLAQDTGMKKGEPAPEDASEDMKNDRASEDVKTDRDTNEKLQTTMAAKREKEARLAARAEGKSESEQHASEDLKNDRDAQAEDHRCDRIAARSAARPPGGTDEGGAALPLPVPPGGKNNERVAAKSAKKTEEERLAETAAKNAKHKLLAAEAAQKAAKQTKKERLANEAASQATEERLAAEAAKKVEDKVLAAEAAKFEEFEERVKELEKRIKDKGLDDGAKNQEIEQLQALHKELLGLVEA